MSTGSLIARLGARLIGALARYLAQPVSRPAASSDVLALSPRLRLGDVLLTEGSTRAAALARRLTRSPWAHVSIYVRPLEPGDDSPCIVEADIGAGVRAVPLSEFNGLRARIVRPLGLNETDRQRLADWLVSHIGAPYDLALAWALTRRCLKLPAQREMVQDAKRFICSSLLVQAFLFVGHPVAAGETRYLVPRDFERAAGFEVVTALG
jgi:Permuted papain-like amidase enzyme, YaeF/YiiX, C92 family